jgi:hypothetical protein
VGWVSTLQNIIGDVAVIVIELGGSKNRSKRGCGIATRHFYRNGPFFPSILVAYRQFMRFVLVLDVSTYLCSEGSSDSCWSGYYKSCAELDFILSIFQVAILYSDL